MEKLKRGFTVLELLVVLVAVTIIASVGIYTLSSLKDFYDYFKSVSLLNEAKKKIEDYYRTHVFEVNSNPGFRYGNCTINTLLNFVPRAASLTDPTLGCLGQIIPDVYDHKGSNFRIFIQNGVDPQGRFQFKRILLVMTGSPINLPPGSVGFNPDGSVRCRGDFTCVAIDGFAITEEVYMKELEFLGEIASAFRAYKDARYAADPTKNPLIYRYSNSGSNIDYYDVNGIIPNTCSSGGTTVLFYNGYVVNSSLFTGTNNCFVNLSNLNVSFLAGFNLVSPSGFPVYFDNTGPSVSNPDNQIATYGSIVGGYNALLFSCMDVNSCIVFPILH